MGVLSGPIDMDPRRKRTTYPTVAARPGLAVTHRGSGVSGTIVSFRAAQTVVRDRAGRDHTFRTRDGDFLVDGKPVALRPPKSAADAAAKRTASGSIDLGTVPARMARASRIYVEGVHDAELVEKVWGDDLRAEGVVVEYMAGMDDLAMFVRGFGPGAGRRLGILLDHLVDGSKEQRAAAAIDHPDVLITGHPYIDVWQAVKPSVAGIAAWPSIPRDRPWKEGVCEAIGWQGTPAGLWKQLLGRVRSYADLEPGLVGAVEQLIDFVAPPAR
ncbi:MAG TPA: DUF3097 family protein [Acidimicrobiales bacterium]|jgi:hypothetical protein|nr:DUF3097 family protein [Acidimicrobiales bacterium]